MPMTVITLKNSPSSLRGDLTKWMQEIATGVYVGNFNSRIREQLWERVKQSVGTGEATMSFAFRNEIGYQFETVHTQRQAVDHDGIPLVMIVDPKGQENELMAKRGYSKAYQFTKAKQYQMKKDRGAKETTQDQPSFVVLDIETNGLDEKIHTIIEIGALKVEGTKIVEFQRLVKCESTLSAEIVELTGITDAMLAERGIPIYEAVQEFLVFIEDMPLVGYALDFDLKFLNKALKERGQAPIKNAVFDVRKYVKREKMFLANYKLETALQGYGIKEKVLHRALEDARLTYLLASKVNKFLQKIN